MIREYKKRPGTESVFASPNVKAIKMSDSNLDKIKKLIQKLRRPIQADKGEYIVMDENGGFYPCRPVFFEAVYEEV